MIRVMDVLYHGVTGMMIARAFGTAKPEIGALFAMLPDLVGIWPFYYYKAKEAVSLPGRLPANFLACASSNRFSGRLDAHVYRLTHSLISAGMLTLVLRLLAPGAWLPLSLSYLSHILIDIPTHEGDFATRFFYPLSPISFPGYNWARHRWLAVSLWGLLLLAVGIT